MKTALILPPTVSDAEVALGELVSAAKQAIGHSAELELIAFHLDKAEAARLAADTGVSNVATLQSPFDAALASYPDNLVIAAVSACHDARAILIPAGPGADELATRLAFRLGAAFIGNCIGIEGQGPEATFSHSICGGRAVETVKPQRTRLVMTIARKRFGGTDLATVATTHRAIDVSALTFTRPAISERESLGGETSRRLTQSSIVVAGGRGLGSAEGFEALDKLATALNAAVGASRAAVDAGWAPHSIQVGQTGKVIAPDVYFAIGISGAPQHVAGIAGAKVVVAINTDEQAPIFQWAHFGIVDDYRPVLTELITSFAQLAPT